jgi:hypothetical protein
LNKKTQKNENFVKKIQKNTNPVGFYQKITKKTSQTCANFLCNLIRFSRRILRGRPMTKHSIASHSRYYMKMQMLDKLPCRPAIVAQDIIAISTNSIRNS